MLAILGLIRPAAMIAVSSDPQVAAGEAGAAAAAAGGMISSSFERGGSRDGGCRGRSGRSGRAGCRGGKNRKIEEAYQWPGGCSAPPPARARARARSCNSCLLSFLRCASETLSASVSSAQLHHRWLLHLSGLLIAAQGLGQAPCTGPWGVSGCCVFCGCE